MGNLDYAIKRRNIVGRRGLRLWVRLRESKLVVVTESQWPFAKKGEGQNLEENVAECSASPFKQRGTEGDLILPCAARLGCKGYYKNPPKDPESNPPFPPFSKGG